MDLQWWCAAVDEPWTWSWRPYPGVWLVVASIAVAYVAARRTGGGEAARQSPEADAGATGSTRDFFWTTERREVTCFSAGLFLLWAGLDWPLGALGASYLASVHMVQYLLVGLVVPALFLLGIPRHLYDALEGRPRLLSPIRAATHPVVALIVFNLGMTVTHWPGTVDLLRASQVGSFALDVSWLFFGLVFWWPLVAPVPERPGFHPLLRVAYLASNIVFIMPPVAMMLFSESPIYATYELAPPVGGLEPLWDQQQAGAIMKVGSAWIMVVAMLVVAYRWYLEAREEPVEVFGR